MRAFLWTFSFIIAGLYIVSPIIDPDLWWHIAIGRWIIANGHVPTHEHWNAFALGQPFRAYSWMNEVLFAWIEGTFGLDGLFWAKLLLGQLIAFSLFFVYSKIAGDWFFGLLLGVMAVVTCQGHFTLRPQSFTWIYLAWLLYFTDLACRKDRLFPAAFGVMAVMCLWANIHITTALGLAAVFFWAASKERVGLTAWLIFFGALGTVLTPYLGAEWLTFISKSGHPLEYSSISEFQPATILQYPTGFVLLGMFVLSMFFYFHPSVILPGRLIYAGILLLGGLAIIKFLPYAAIFVFAVVASGWRKAREEGKEFGNFSEAVSKFEALFRHERLPAEGLGFIMVCVIYVLVNQVTATKLETAVVPKNAVDFIAEKELQPPVLHTFGYGGYMMYHFADSDGEAKEKVMIDGRTNITPHEISEYGMSARTGLRDWRKILEVTEPNSILWPGESPLVTILLLTGEWCIVFEEPESILHHTVLIKRTEYDQRSEEFPDAVCDTEMVSESGSDGWTS